MLKKYKIKIIKDFEYPDHHNYSKKDIEQLRKKYEEDDEKFEEKLEETRCKEIKALLFDEYLRETNNEKVGNQSVTKFFIKK